MPKFRPPFRPDGGEYILASDLALPADQRVTWRYRDPLPSEVAEFEETTGHMQLGDLDASADGGTRHLRGEARWISHGPTNALKALKRFLTAVEGRGASGDPLVWPMSGDDLDGRRERFLAQFEPTDLREVADAVLERRHLTEEQRGES